MDDVKAYLNQANKRSNSEESPERKQHLKNQDMSDNSTNPVAKKLKTESESACCDKFKFSNKPCLEDIRSLLADFKAERNWDKFHSPRNVLLAMVGEVGEVAELFQWRGEVAKGLPDWSADEKTALGEELSDVLLYLVSLAENCHVDLPQAVLRKMEKNRQKYPIEKAYGVALKYTQLESNKHLKDPEKQEAE